MTNNDLKRGVEIKKNEREREGERREMREREMR